jgi:hypothetical protein
MLNRSARSTLHALNALALTALCTSAISADSYSASDDFVPNQNPNGVWSYGWAADLSGSFAPYDTTYANSEGLDIWNAASQGSNPSLVHNGTGSDVTYSSDGIVFEAGMLALHPGPSGQQSRVQFTVPTSGSWSMDVQFESIDSTGGSTDVHVLLNGTPIFSDDVIGFGDVAAYAASGMALNMGDVVEFAVGFGYYSYYDDSTSLDAVLELESSGCTAPSGLVPTR